MTPGSEDDVNVDNDDTWTIVGKKNERSDGILKNTEYNVELALVQTSTRGNDASKTRSIAWSAWTAKQSTQVVKKAPAKKTKQLTTGKLARIDCNQVTLLSDLGFQWVVRIWASKRKKHRSRLATKAIPCFSCLKNAYILCIISDH